MLSGCLSDCYAVLDPTPYFRDCVYDVCASPEDGDTALCNAMASYTQACRYFYVDVPSWRNATLCPLTCPSNSTYGNCISACPRTCWDYQDPDRTCYDLCVEGCACDEGFVLEDLRCIPESECGCVTDGFYLTVGSNLLTPDCSEYCECNPGGSINCTQVSCDPNASCGVVDGQTRCICNAGYDSVGFGFTCFDIDECESSPCANGTCVDEVDGYTCDCTPGWTGKLCAQKDECYSDPCQNGATCRDGVDRFTCVCAPGWTDEFCGTGQ
ncbi:fibropellin-1-like [Lytechinus pictus]|uniref:fibropellin-1-like n=1 Tax=Lytechinus pictus TaxID=7653 RepID=UPI0030BA0C45